VSSASFSLDGTRIVTGGEDGTAKVWDARTGRPLLDLKGHTATVWSVAFSPDGVRIVTGSGAFRKPGEAKVWDARTGTLVYALEGQPAAIWSVSFSQDGTRVITFDDNGTAKVWDMRTGLELKGEPIPPTPRPTQISPDGRLIAHNAGDRVELIPLEPDAEEISYRLIVTRPNLWRYREGYDAARAAKNDFAARFYYGLLPTRSRADAIIAPLFASLVIRDDVLASLKAEPADDPEVQAACLELAESWTESANACDSVGHDLVYAPGKPDATYQRGLRLYKAACRLEPNNGEYLKGLGAAQYRCGLVAEADEPDAVKYLNKVEYPSYLAYLAMAQSRLGLSDQARTTLGRLREVMKNPQWSGNPEAQGFLREAETIELDRVFPADPFAP
jgi:WD domain, G-beta repeat